MGGFWIGRKTSSAKALSPVRNAIVIVQNGKAMCNSRDVAAMFGRQHKNVLQDLRALHCSPKFTELNFQPSTYKDSTGRSLPCYNMTKDGFVFLVMGFTGAEAARFKEAYIERFNQLEAGLKDCSPFHQLTEIT